MSRETRDISMKFYTLCCMALAARELGEELSPLWKKKAQEAAELYPLLPKPTSEQQQLYKQIQKLI